MMFSVQTHLMKLWPLIISLFYVFMFVCLFVFSFEKHQRLVFNAGCLVSKWRSSFEGFMALLGNHSPHTIQGGLGGCELTFFSEPTIEGLLVFSFKCTFLYVGNLRVFCRLNIGSFPLVKEALQQHFPFFTHFG